MIPLPQSCQAPKSPLNLKGMWVNALLFLIANHARLIPVGSNIRIFNKSRSHVGHGGFNCGVGMVLAALQMRDIT